MIKTCINRKLPIEFPEVSLTLFELYGIILKEGDLKVFLIDFNGKTVPNILDGKILPDAFELTYNNIVMRS